MAYPGGSFRFDRSVSTTAAALLLVFFYLLQIWSAGVLGICRDDGRGGLKDSRREGVMLVFNEISVMYAK